MKKLLLRLGLILVLTFLVTNSTSGAAAQSIPTSSQTSGLGPELELSPTINPGQNRYLPDVAYNTKNQENLVVWHSAAGSTYYIEGRRLTRSGLAGDVVPLVSSSVAVKQPAVAYNAIDNQYHLLWMQNTSGDGKQFDVWGKILSGDNLYPVRPDFQIDAWIYFSLWTPRVVWNSKQNQYLVIYNLFKLDTGLPEKIEGQVLNHNGDHAWWLQVTEVGFPQNPDLVYNAQSNSYYAVWRVMGTGVSYGQICATQFNWNVAIAPSPVQLNPSERDQRYPRVATDNKTGFMVVWEENIPPNEQWYVLGREVDLTGAAVHEPQLITCTQSSTEESMPTVTGWDGIPSRYLVTYQLKTDTGVGVYMAFNDNYQNTITFLGNVNWVDNFPVMDAGFWTATRPEVAVSGLGGAIVAYQGDSTSDPAVDQHIFARTWIPHVIFIPLTKNHTHLQ